MASTLRRDIEIDPLFHVPPNVIDVRQQNKESGDKYYDTSTQAVDPIISTPTSTIPMPPSSFQVIDQVVRISPDGSSVVDITLEFPDLPSITGIEVHVTKI
jgi:hypothetical protein